MIELTVYGEPIAQGRPKFSVNQKKNGKIFTSARDPRPSKDYKAYVKMMASNVRPHKPLDGPIAFELAIYRMIPKSTTKKRRAAIDSGECRPVVKPDVDNVYKAVSDALTGLIYQDDKQIVDVHIAKFYSDNPRVEIKIHELDGVVP